MVHSIEPLRVGTQVSAYLEGTLRAVAAVADGLPVFTRCRADGPHLDALHAAPCVGTHVRSLGHVVLPTPTVKKGRIRVSYTATHRSR
ncbi:MAG TPA: hypothetical protein VHX38_08590 [Pseudonocardiaceae bacterium]|jgi:hypothetical protein|nr:hypothetical protein [Pseudonocardiaceae bacterium]